MFRRSRPTLSYKRQDEEAGLDQEWRCGSGCSLGFPNQSCGCALALYTESSAGTSQQGHSYDVAKFWNSHSQQYLYAVALGIERPLNALHVSLFMARISVGVRRHNRRQGGTHTYETTDEDLPVLLERLFKERRL